MKSIFRFLWFMVLFIALISESFAIDSPTNLKVESSTDNSVVVTWDEPENAIMYYVYYSKNSGINGAYDNSTDLVEWNSTEITDLVKWETYYFSVTWFDENWEESNNSDEISYTVNAGAPSLESDFALDWVSVVSYDKIELTFTNPLDDSEDAIREFKITNKADPLDTFEVISTELDEDDKSIVELTLDKDTKIWNEYEVVIIAITSSEWKNIESWIDNIETFTVNEIIDTDIVDEWVELNAAWIDDANPAWTNLGTWTNDETTLELAGKQTSLPQTWPEHVLMLILSIILWALIFIFNYKKA